MYTEYYGLEQEPFRLTPDPQFYFLGDVQNKALANLLYGINNKKGFIALTGEVGAGKTTLCRLLLKQLDDSCSVAIILNSLVDETTFLKQINRDLAIPYNTDSHDELIGYLYEFLIQEKKKGGNVLVIVDEAQNLKFEVLEQIRMLSNLETEKDKLLQILLIGQPEFLEMLNSYKLRQLNQRITVRAHISALTLVDMEKYIYHRLKIAGNGNAVTFTRSALKKIYSYSGGIPRRVNVLTDYALLAGYVEGTRKIDRVIVKKALKDIEIKRTGGVSTDSQKGMSKKVLVTLAVIIFLISGAVVIGKETNVFSFSAIKNIIEKGPLYSNVFSSLDSKTSTAEIPTSQEIQEVDVVPLKENGDSTAVIDKNEIITQSQKMDEIPENQPEIKQEKQQEANDLTDKDSKKEEVVIPEPEEKPVIPDLEDPSEETAEVLEKTVSEPAEEVVEPVEPLKEVESPVEKTPSRESAFEKEITIPEHRPASRIEKYYYSLSPEEKGIWLLLSRWGIEISHDRKDAAGWRVPLENQLSRFAFSLYATWGDLAFLKKLNLPAALEIEKDGIRRYVTLIGVKDQYLRLLVGPGLYEVKSEKEFLPFWQGNAFVIVEKGDYNIESKKPVFKGSEGADVIKVKNILKSMKLFSGESDNIFGLELEKSVKAFQEEFSIPVDGIVGVETKLLLYSTQAKNVPRIIAQEKR